MTMISAVLVGVVVLGGLGGCASRPSVASQQAENWRNVHNNYQRCLTRADEAVAGYEEYIKTHPAGTRTPKEEFITQTREYHAKHAHAECETNYASDTQMLRDADREIDRLQPRTLILVP